MARPYRVSFLRTIFLSAFFIALASAAPARADDDIYMIAGVKVDVTAANAADAKTQAFNQAETAAMTQLAGRLLGPDRAKTFLPPTPDQIATMVDDFEITNEQLSTTRYIGTYTFRFNHGATKSYIMSKAAVAPEPAPVAAATGAPEQTATDDAGQPESAAASPLPARPRTAMDSGTVAHASLTARVHFSSIGEWLHTQRALRQTPGVVNLSVRSLAPTQATITLNYSGSEGALRQSLEQSGITLAGGSPEAQAAPERDWNQAYDPSAAAAMQPESGGDGLYDITVTGSSAPSPY
jgi:hypothetical protein